MRKILTIILLVLIAGLLIGQRFDFDWAGGDGYSYAVPVKVVEVVKVVEMDRVGMIRKVVKNDLVARGEMIKTGDESRILLDIEGTKIGLDERTDLKIEVLAPDQIQLSFIRGRIKVFQPETNREIFIKTKNTRSQLSNGVASFINYDFKETVSVIPIDGIISVTVGDDKEFMTEEPIDIHEAEPVDIIKTTFDAKTSAAWEFYEWFEQITDYPKTSSDEVVLKKQLID